ncbi:MAG TPA: O-antigen ligase family protein [Spirillospora sp.]|nr:O-antigen ligase family protein [Spirillospora sp.]
MPTFAQLSVIEFLKLLARIVLWLEPLALALMTLAFWYPTPARLDWLWLLWLLPLILAARYIAHERLITRTPLDGWFLAFLVLGALNVYIAPYTRGLLMLARPLLGMALYYAMIESARVSGRMRGPLQAVTMLGLLVGVLAIGSTQWSNKAPALDALIAAMPTLRGFPGAESGFNANEMAGALAWLVPLMAGLALYRWQQRQPRWAVIAAFVLLFTALFLGQGRAAIIGVFLALLLLIPLLIRRNLMRGLAFAALALMIAAQVGVSISFAQQQIEQVEAAASTGTNAEPVQLRDAQTIEARLQIWSSALAILRDYPLTGVGLSMFRDGRVRADYPVPMLEGRILPHAHNELLQVASDMGLPGLIVYAGIHAAAGYMLLQSWRRGDGLARAVSAAVAGGLLAHTIYGLADAITLWDRFAFVFWMLLGLTGAQYTLVQQNANSR